MNIENFSSKTNNDKNIIHERVPYGNKSKFKCACGNIYSYIRSLNYHIKRKIVSYTCPHCSKVMTNRNGFKNHLDNRVCRRDTSDSDDDELIVGKKRSSSSNISSRKSKSRPPPNPSNARG